MKKIFLGILLILISLVSLSSASAVCGNGVIDAGEQCDSTNLNGQTCATIGGASYPSALLGCYPAGSQFQCYFNTIACNSYPNLIPCLTNTQCVAGSHCDTTSNHYYCVAGSAPASTPLVISDSVGNEISELLINGQEDQIVTGTLYVKNTGTTTLALTANSFSYVASEFTEGSRTIVITFENVPSTIAPGENKPVTVKANIPNNMDLDTYSGTLTLTSGAVSDTTTLKIRVQPEVCEDGVVGKLRVTIDEPDNGDEYAPGETIKLEINVENDDDDDMDVIVEAFLYNLNQDEEVVREESEADEVPEGEDVDFELELDIPHDEDLDEDDEYILYVKAYEDGDEDKNCAQDTITIDIEREKYDVVINKFDARPTAVKPGEMVSFEVNVANEGTKKIDDAYIEIKEAGLGIGERTEEFELEDYQDDANDATKRFTFKIPENAKAGDYMVEAIVTYRNGDNSDSEFVTVKVLGEEVAVTKGINLALTTTTTSFDVNDRTGKLHLIITNNENKDLTGTVEVNPVGSWANNVPAQSVSLHTGENNLYLDLPLSVSEAGKQSANVIVRIPNYDAKQFTLSFDVTGEKEGKLSGLLGSTTLLVIGYVVLVLVGLYLLKLIFSRPRSKSLI